MLTGMVIFLLLLIVLLAVPVTLTFKMSWQQVFQSDVKLFWLFGLVRVHLPSFQSKATPQEGVELVQEIDRLEQLPHKKQNVFAFFRQKAFRQRIIKFIIDLWHAVHKRNVSLRVRLGLGDPADTGQLWAVIGPVAGMLSNAKEASIEIVPDFFDIAFELDSSGNIRLIPLQIIYLIIGLLLSPAIWQGVKRMRIVGK